MVVDGLVNDVTSDINGEEKNELIGLLPSDRKEIVAHR